MTDGIAIKDERLEALAAFLGEDADDWSEAAYQQDGLYECGQRAYLVLTGDEADKAAAEYIADSLWAFNASFLVDFLPDGVGTEVVEALQPQCEGANDAIRAMVGERFDDLVSAAISADGRGHFLNTYDAEENEQGEWFIYRTN